jgi:hypothetical protein
MKTISLFSLCLFLALPSFGATPPTYADTLITTNFIMRAYSGRDVLTMKPFHILGEDVRLEFTSYGSGFTNSTVGLIIYDLSGFLISPNISVSGDLTVGGNLVTSATILWQTNAVNVSVTNATTADYAKTCTGVMYTNVYRALLTQGGTAAPTAVVLENTFGYGSGYTNLVWARTAAGTYTVTFTNGFPTNKTFVRLSGAASPTFGYYMFPSGCAISANTVKIFNGSYVFATSGGYVTSVTYGFYDSLLTNTPIEILVYP